MTGKGKSNFSLDKQFSHFSETYMLPFENAEIYFGALGNDNLQRSLKHYRHDGSHFTKS